MSQAGGGELIGCERESGFEGDQEDLSPPMVDFWAQVKVILKKCNF